MAKFMRKLLLVQFIFALSMACSAMAEVEDAYVFWKDPQIAQLEELTAKLVDSVQKMQSKIVEEIEITPEEVRQFFSSFPKNERPVFGAELEIAQIVIDPRVSEDDENKVVKRLETIKYDIEVNGSSFATKAILYSQDPGSRRTGGKYTLNRNRPRFDKNLRDVAYRLREGEISDPFRSQFGWHIVKVERIRGQEVDIRHILLIPELTDQSLLVAI